MKNKGYTMGRSAGELSRGVNIVVYSDGSTRKM